jgi:NADH:ubiquinone oxidoreductase subunit 5 (subunit L)/multisubunit Na+/H+ antiporter MnhA subunit
VIAVAWAVVLLPLAGALLSFVAETPRRAAQVCMTTLGAALVISLIVLGYRFAHLTTSATPGFSAVSFFAVSPSSTETPIFSSSVAADLGVMVDNLSTSFMALATFLFLATQWLATAMIRGDPGYRRFFWGSSVLASATLGMIAAPGLFQAWMALGVGSAALFILTLHRWHREDGATAANRSFLTLLAADLVLLLGLVFTVDKLGTTLGGESAPAGFTVPPMFDYRILDAGWSKAIAGQVAHIGYRSLVLMCLLLALPALVRSAQIPFTSWLSRLREAPLPVLAAISASLLSGVVLLARIYPLLLGTRHALSGLAVVAALGALGLAAACAASRDIYRFALLFAACQQALAMTAMGAGGYSLGLLIAYVSAPLSLLLFAVGASVARAYRTRDTRLMGGAWGRMRRTSLGFAVWAVLTGGVDLVAYDLLASILHNRFPNAGHMAGWVAGLVLGLSVAALLLVAIAAGRLFVAVCAGRPASRRGGVVERITEAEPRLLLTQAALAAAGLFIVIAGLPGITAHGEGKGRVPGLTFSHWVFYGPHRQSLPVEGLALAIAAGILVIGLGGGFLTARTGWAEGRTRLRVPAVDLAPIWAWALSRAVTAGQVLAGEVSGVDRTLVEPLYDASGEAVETAAWSLGRLRSRRLRVGLAAALTLVLVLAGLSVLAAGGRLPVHTT